MQKIFYVRITLWLGLIIALILAIIDPKTKHQQCSSQTFLICLDSSASLSTKEKGYLLKALQKFISYKKSNHNFEFIIFGSNLQRKYFPPRVLPPQMKTNLKNALEFAIARIKNKKLPGRIAIFTDAAGLKKTEFLISKCQKEKIPLYFWTPKERTREFKIISLHLPKKVETGIQVPIEIQYSSNYPGMIDLEIYSNQKLYFKKKEKIKAGKGFIKLRGKAFSSKGIQCMKVIAKGDHRAENNTAMACTRIIELPKILMISNQSDSILSKALRFQQIRVKNFPWSYFKNLKFPGKYPVWIFDSPSSSLLKKNRQKIKQYLKASGGILVLQGNKLKEKWLPAYFHKEKFSHVPRKNPKKPLEKKKEKMRVKIKLRSAAIVFLIDRSGSMAGKKLILAQLAALKSISKLWIQDLIGVIVFDEVSRWIVPLGRGSDFKRMTRRLLNVRPGGGTKIVQAIRKAYQSLRQINSHIKHIILLSDGQDENPFFARKDLEILIPKMKREKISITTIGVGDDFDTILMPLIAKWGKGSFYYVHDYNRIPSVVLNDVERVLSFRKIPPNSSDRKKPNPIKEKKIKITKPFPPKTKAKKKISVSKSSFCSNLVKSFKKFPDINDIQTYKLRPGVQLELLAKKKPLLMHHQVNLGRVMLWNGKAEEWGAWPFYPMFWARMVRYLSSTSLEKPDFSLYCACIHKQHGEIRISTNITDKAWLKSLKFQSSYDFYRRADNVWYALIPTAPTGKWKYVKVKILWQKKEIANLTTAFGIAYEEEFKDLKIKKDMLRKIAKETGGGILPTEQEKFFEKSYEEVEKSWIELWLLISLFFLAVLMIFV